MNTIKYFANVILNQSVSCQSIIYILLVQKGHIQFFIPLPNLVVVSNFNNSSDDIAAAILSELRFETEDPLSAIPS